MKNETLPTVERIDWRKLDSFTRAYLVCALWSSTDESTPAANYSLDDCAQDFLRQASEDCAAFQRDNEALLNQAGNSEQNGHDFWLTRNGHGAGFWDRGYPDEVSKPLTDAAHAYGSANLYITDAGEVDQM